MTMKGANSITFLSHDDFISFQLKIMKHALLFFPLFRINCMEIVRLYDDFRKIKGVFLFKELQL